MNILTQSLKDAAAQNFKKHLVALNTADLQKQFVAIIFSNYPVDMRLVFYTEIQLTNDNATEQLKNLAAIKTLLGSQICSVYGKDANALTKTRFYTEATTAPSLLDIRIGTFLNQSLQDCNGKTAEAVAAITDLQAKIAARFAKEATTQTFAKLPTKAQAEEILKEENITVAPQDEQKVAEKIEEETQQIEEEISKNPTALEKEVQQIVETITNPIKKTATDSLTEEEIINEDSQTIVAEIIAETEPTQGEITQKEEQIIEEIIDSAEIGETSPLVEELPQAVQEEIAQETHVPLPTATPIPTLAPTAVPVVTEPLIVPTATVAPAVPTPVPTTILEPMVTTVQETTESTTSEPTPTPVTTDTEVVPGL
jgi:polyhydroxyalkanoate synthesis regulator phasin